MTGLGDVPLDILIDVANNLDVKSVVRLAMVSKRLRRDICGTRTVWLDTLRQLLVDECIAPFSFPVDSMSIAELIRGATRSSRLCYSILKDKVPTLPSRRFILDFGPKPQDTSESWAESRSAELYLCPGGRWLLSLAYHGSTSYIFCWDLHNLRESAGRERIFPTAKVAIADNCRWSTLAVQASPSFQRVTILLSYYANETEIHEILHLSWSLNPTRSPLFTRVTSLALNHDGTRPGVRLEGHLVVLDYWDRGIHNEKDIIIWDWQTEQWAIVDVNQFEDETPSFWVDPPKVYLIPDDLDFIWSYEIPPLTAVAQPAAIYPARLSSFPLPLLGNAGDVISLHQHTVLEHWKPLHLRSGHICGLVVVKRNYTGNTAWDVLLLDTSSSPSSRSSPSVGALRVRFHGEAPYSPNMFSKLHLFPPDLLATLSGALETDSAMNTTSLSLGAYHPSSCEPVRTQLVTTLPGSMIGLDGQLCDDPCSVSGTFLFRHWGPGENAVFYTIHFFD